MSKADNLVKLALVPCAGLGTRLRPLTRVVPKELLPYGGQTMIDRLLAELAEAGMEQAVIILRRDKEIVRQHLSESPLPLEFVYQDQPRGLADALRAAAPAVKGAPFLMALPDQQVSLNASRQLVDHYSGQASLSAAVLVPEAERDYFPGAVTFQVEGEGPVFRVTGLAAPGAWRAIGRTVYAAEFLAHIPAESGEDQLGRSFASYLRQGQHGLIRLTGRPADLGTMAGYRYYNRLIEEGNNSAKEC